MTTDRKRVAAYLPDSIYLAFVAYKEEHQINSDSEALNQILAAYFGIESEAAPAVIKQILSEEIQPYLEQLQNLQTQVDSFLKKVSTQATETPPPSMSDFFKSAYDKHYGKK